MKFDELTKYFPKADIFRFNVDIDNNVDFIGDDGSLYSTEEIVFWGDPKKVAYLNMDSVMKKYFTQNIIQYPIFIEYLRKYADWIKEEENQKNKKNYKPPSEKT